MHRILLLALLPILFQNNLKAQSDFEINQRSGTLSTVEQIESIGDNLLVRIHIDDQLDHFTRLVLMTPDGAVISQLNSPGPGVGSDVTIYNDTIYQFIPEDGCDYQGSLFSLNRYTPELMLVDQFEGEQAWEFPYFLPEADIHTAHINMLNDSILLFSNNKGLEFFNTYQHILSEQIAFEFGFSDPASIVLSQDSILLYSEPGIYLATNGTISQVSTLGFSFLTRHNGLYYGITSNNDIQMLDETYNVIATIDMDGQELVKKICFDSNKVYAVGLSPVYQGHLITMSETLSLESEVEIPETDLLSINCFYIENGRLYLGGTNYSEDVMYGSHCIKSYSVEPLAEDFQEDIGVTDFILSDYFFTPVGFNGGPTYYALSISGTLEITNFTDHEVTSANACMVSTPIFNPWCSNIVSFYSIPTIGPNATVSINVGTVFYSAQYYSSEYGLTIDTDLCFSTHAPNLHMDDIPENDRHCETVQVTVTGISEENPVSSFCYFDANNKTINIRAEFGNNYALFDTMGKKMTEGQVLSPLSIIQADDFSSGMYYVLLESGGRLSSMKVIVR